LRAGGAGRSFEREAGQAGARQALQALGIEGVEHAHHDGAGLHERQLGLGGGAHLEHELAGEGAGGIGDLGTRRLEGSIGDGGSDAGAGLHAHGVPLRDKLLGRLGCDGHSGFAGHGFGRHAYQHGVSPRGSVGIRAELT
jgi:hypothetical protein